MNLIDILPVLIPTAIFQIIMQVYTIKHAWNQTDLSERIRIWLIISFIFFNFLAISIYLFYVYKKDRARYNDEINPNFRRGVLVITVISLQFFILQLIAFDQSFNETDWVVWLGTFVYVLIILNEVLVSLKKVNWTYLTSIIIFGSSLAIEYLTQSSPIQMMTLIVMVGILNVLPSHKSRYIIFSTLILYFGFTVIKVNALFSSISSDSRIAFVYTNTLFFILVVATFSTLKRHLIANQQLHDNVLMLEEQAKTIEALTAKAERSRIASDIHDHVGHTLTTAVIQLESALTLLSDEQTQLKDKIELSKDQVKYGLNQIRSLVSGVDIIDTKDFVDNLLELIEKTEKTAPLKIHLEYENRPELIMLQQRILLSAIKEFFTNAMKHGRAKHVDILLSSSKKRLEMTLTNDGTSSSSIIYGYGLTHIDQAITSIGGFIKVSSHEDLGFTLYLSLPLGGEDHV